MLPPFFIASISYLYLLCNKIRKNNQKSFLKDLTNVKIRVIIVVSFRTRTKNKEDEIVDKVLLEYEMRKRGITITDMCEMLGISRSAYYRKCNGKSEFTVGEIKKIVEFLNLESPMAIFFA